MPLIYTLLLSVGAAALHTRLYTSHLGQQLELYQSDLWFRVRGPISTPENVVIVAIDEPTYQEMGFSHVKPLSRAAVGAIVQALSKAGAELAVLDMFFKDKGESAEDNQLLADALGSMPTFIGSFLYAPSPQSPAYDELGEVLPQQQFEARAKEVAMMNLFEEPKVRHFTVFRFNGTYEPLPIVFARYRGLQVPQSTDLINYYGPPGSIPQVSAYKVLKDSAEINRERFRGKIVLIGSAVPAGAAFSVKDAFFVPGSAQSSVGVEIHSTVISNILKREWIRRIPPQYELPIVNGILVVAAFVLGRLTPRVAVLSAAAFVLVWILSAYLSFTRSLFLPGVNLCLIVLPLMMLATLLAKLNILRKKQEQLERMLGVDLED